MERSLAERVDELLETELVPTAQDLEVARRLLRSQPLLVVLAHVASKARAATANKLLGMNFSIPEQTVQAAKLQGKAEGIVSFLEHLLDLLEEEENVSPHSD